MPDFPKKLNKKQKEAFLHELPFHILLPSVIEDYRLFSKYLNSYIQDSYCEDCLNTTDECECDYCDSCKLNRCMCDINSYDELIDIQLIDPVADCKLPISSDIANLKKIFYYYYNIDKYEKYITFFLEKYNNYLK